MDCKRYETILSYRDPSSIPDGYVPTDVNRVWAVRWFHTGGSLARGSDSTKPGPFDGPYIRCWEEKPYVGALECYVGKHLEDPSTWSTATMQDRLPIPVQYEGLYICNKVYWGKDLGKRYIFV